MIPLTTVHVRQICWKIGHESGVSTSRDPYEPAAIWEITPSATGQMQKCAHQPLNWMKVSGNNDLNGQEIVL